MNVLMCIGAAGGVALVVVVVLLARAYQRHRRLKREWQRFIMDPVRPLRRLTHRDVDNLRSLFPARSFRPDRDRGGR